MLARSAFSVVILGVVGAVTACSSSMGSGAPGEPESPGPAGPSGGFAQDKAPTDPATMPDLTAMMGCGKMDLLFVVDDSPSMSEEQTNLGKNFPDFVKVLEEYKTQTGQPLDFRVAVTTTGRDMKVTSVEEDGSKYTSDLKGDNGALRSSTVCDAPNKWLSKGEQDIARKFACVAKVGTSGPWLEMPLYAAKLALDERMADGTNKGFLREDALLALVILTDEDDCSREDNNFSIDLTETNAGCQGAERRAVSQYGAFLDKIAPGRWATHVIAGPGPGTCNSPGLGNAAEATRLKEFVSRAGKNGSFSSICEGDLSGGLKQALSTFDYACKNITAPGPK